MPSLENHQFWRKFKQIKYLLNIKHAVNGLWNDS